MQNNNKNHTKQFAYVEVKPVIAYLRVSTPKQGEDGFGIAAQKLTIENYCSKHSLDVKEWLTEVASGAGQEALNRRPVLAKAFNLADSIGGKVIVAKLDRLSRSGTFISSLTESRKDFDFISCEFPPGTPSYLFGFMGQVANIERDFIAERVKLGMAEAKKRGVHCGRPKGKRSSYRENDKIYEDLVKPLIDEDLTYQEIAERLGEGWNASKVANSVASYKRSHGITPNKEGRKKRKRDETS